MGAFFFKSCLQNTLQQKLTLLKYYNKDQTKIKKWPSGIILNLKRCGFDKYLEILIVNYSHKLTTREKYCIEKHHILKTANR